MILDNPKAEIVCVSGSHCFYLGITSTFTSLIVELKVHDG